MNDVFVEMIDVRRLVCIPSRSLGGPFIVITRNVSSELIVIVIIVYA